MFDIVSTLVGAGTSALGGLVGYQAQKSIQNKQNKWQEKMWRMNNEYNTPANQRKRFEQAGLNPNLMMNGSTTGTATTATAPSAPDVASGINSAAQGVNSSLQTGIEQQNANTNMRVGEANAKKLEADAQGRIIQNGNQFAKDIATIKNLNVDSDIKRKQEQLLRDTMDANILSAKANADKVSAEAMNEYTRNALLTTQWQMEAERLKWLPSQLAADLQNVIANTAASCAQRGLYAAQARQAMSTAALLYLQGQGVKIDNKVKRDTIDYVETGIKGANSSLASQSRIDKANADAFTNGWNTFLRGFGLSSQNIVDLGKQSIQTFGKKAPVTNINNSGYHYHNK